MWANWRPDSGTVLRDKKVRTSLARYFSVMEDDKPAKFLIARKLPANFKNDSLTELWKLHEQLTEEFCRLVRKIDTSQKQLDDLTTPDQSFFDLKIEIADHILENIKRAQCSGVGEGILYHHLVCESWTATGQE